MAINAYFNNYWPFTSKLKKNVIFFLLLRDDNNQFCSPLAFVSYLAIISNANTIITVSKIIVFKYIAKRKQL